MLIKTDWSVLRKTKWNDYAVRFVLGGSITVAAGLIARKFGPGVGGLFLAFPAIFPASATLAEKREKERKLKKGLSGVVRGRLAAGAEAAGTAIGSVGLLAFACVFWKLLPNWRLWLVFVIAVVAWGTVAVTLWLARKRVRFRRRSTRECFVGRLRCGVSSKLVGVRFALLSDAGERHAGKNDDRPDHGASGDFLICQDPAEKDGDERIHIRVRGNHRGRAHLK